MKRREILGAMAAVSAMGLAPSRAVATAGPDRTRRRNVVLLVSDDQGLDLGSLGGMAKTPILDALGAEGTRYDHAYAAVSSCSPSRAVLYTGLYTHQNGMYGLAHDVHNQGLKDGIETLPFWLKRAGYATALVGKKHVRPDSAFPYDAELAPERSGIRDVALIADAAELFIRGIGDTPFFITVGYSDPHRAPENFGNTPDWPRVHRVRYDPATVQVPSHLPDIPAVRADLAQYYESVSRLDEGVGMIREALARTGHADDTMIIFLSDNGRPFPGAKTNLYDPGLHLPLIIHSPGSPGNAVSDAMVSWVDIAPTILEWTGAVGPSYRLPGRSLMPLLGQRVMPGWDSIFASHDFHEINQYYPMRAVRTRTRSYIENLAWQLPYPVAGDVAQSESWQAISANPDIRLGKRTQAAYFQRPAREFYDLERDPDEVLNLASRAASKAERDALAARLLEFRTSTRDPWAPGQTKAH